ncbi:dihydroorotase [Clostridia bacterium]|nr:dihydroorotase [Clostridia bacterium]
MVNLLIKQVRWVNPYEQTDEIKDIYIREGEIAIVGNNLNPERVETIDGDGLVLCPGFIDMHVHLREPGYEHKETILTGMQAAAHGGFTAIAPMPNSKPAADSAKTIRYILDKSEAGPVEVLPIGAITQGLKGEKLTDLAELKKAGVVAFSDDGMAVMDSETMKNAMQISKGLGAVVIDHCEDLSLTKNGVLNKGPISEQLGLPGIPRAAEDIMTARDILLAKEYDLPIHIAHVSTKTSVDLIRHAKAEGVDVTAEATPHHFSLTDESLLTNDANYKVSPPLRGEMDRLAVVEAIKDGTIDMFTTDHAPHSQEEKAKGLENAPKGMIGLETCFGVINTELVRKGVIDLVKAIEMLTIAPYTRFSLPEQCGNPMEGLANLVLIDPERKWEVRREDFYSKSINSPFLGTELYGKVLMTIAGGDLAMRDDNVTF